MKKVIIDTNALISFVTDRNIDQQVLISSLLEDALKAKHSILCHLNFEPAPTLPWRKTHQAFAKSRQWETMKTLCLR